MSGIDHSKLFTPMKGGKKVLSPKDMAERSGLEESYVRKAMKHGFLNPPHYSSTQAVDGVELTPEDQAKVEKNVESIKARRGPGFSSDENIRNVARAKVIEEARMEGRPVFFKFKEKSAEEVFDEFWASPAGKRRMVPGPGGEGKLKKEIDNIDRGGNWYDSPMGLHSMPDSYDQILWDKTREEAARLHVLAITGDEEAAEKYRKIQAKYPQTEQFPQGLPELKRDEVKKR